MNNFIFQNPTKLIFGENTINLLETEIPLDKKIMLTYGCGSIKNNGIYNQVTRALKNHNYIEFGNIEPNPTIETLRKAIKLGKENDINFLLAVGGGSVIDGTKLISAGIPFQGDAWEIVLNSSLSKKYLPYATVLTLPATGSEMNKGAVISCKETKEKFSFSSSYPIFSILDPKTTFFIPDFFLACGIADTFVHVMEQHLTVTTNSIVMDRSCEGILKTLIDIAPFVKSKPKDYNIMANFMLSATIALNGFISMGSIVDWSTHMIGHEITALTGLTHGQTLAIILPATMSVLREQKKMKIFQYGHRIFDITEKNNKAIDKIIAETECFFRSLGLATRLSEVNIFEDTINEVERRFNARGVKCGENKNVDGAIAKKILKACK